MLEVIIRWKIKNRISYTTFKFINKPTHLILKQEYTCFCDMTCKLEKAYREITPFHVCLYMLVS